MRRNGAFWKADDRLAERAVVVEFLSFDVRKMLTKCKCNGLFWLTYFAEIATEKIIQYVGFAYAKSAHCKPLEWWIFPGCGRCWRHDSFGCGVAQQGTKSVKNAIFAQNYAKI